MFKYFPKWWNFARSGHAAEEVNFVLISRMNANVLSMYGKLRSLAAYIKCDQIWQNFNNLNIIFRILRFFYKTWAS